VQHKLTLPGLRRIVAPVRTHESCRVIFVGFPLNHSLFLPFSLHVLYCWYSCLLLVHASPKTAFLYGSFLCVEYSSRAAMSDSIIPMCKTIRASPGPGPIADGVAGRSMISVQNSGLFLPSFFLAQQAVRSLLAM
jgi:hypothetical protein